MKFRLTPKVQQVINILKKEGFKITRIKGDHVIVNKEPKLRRPIVLVNVKKPSNVVRLNLLKACREINISEEIIEELDNILH